MGDHGGTDACGRKVVVCFDEYWAQTCRGQNGEYQRFGRTDIRSQAFERDRKCAAYSMIQMGRSCGCGRVHAADARRPELLSRHPNLTHEHDDFSSYRRPAPSSCSSMSVSQNGIHFPGSRSADNHSFKILPAADRRFNTADFLTILISRIHSTKGCKINFDREELVSTYLV